jgi:hypothetical protein
LFTIIQKIFPNQKTIANDRKTIFKIIGRRLELDIYINELKLAFEYQVMIVLLFFFLCFFKGEQHFYAHFLYRDLEMQKERDILKKEACKSFGITLIEIPYWWDGQYESVVATIYRARPDLFQIVPSGDPIPSQQEFELKKMKVKNKV